MRVRKVRDYVIEVRVFVLVEVPDTLDSCSSRALLDHELINYRFKLALMLGVYRPFG